MNIVLVAFSAALVNLTPLTGPQVGSPSGVSSALRTYCEGHIAGHRAFYETTAYGYPGYTGCPGDRRGGPDPYQRGHTDGYSKARMEFCREHRDHRLCR